MKFNQLFLCAIALAVPLTLNAAPQKSKDRWFEIEVILFKQLGDKSQLKETFTEQSELPNYRRVIDLLAGYLNPDIRSLKQLLPRCESPHYAEDLVRQNAKLPPLFVKKSLRELALAPMAIIDNSATSNENLTRFSDNTDFNDKTSFSGEENITDQNNATAESSLKQTTSSLTTIDDLAHATTGKQDINAVEFVTLSQGLTAKQQALVLEAEVAFQSLTFDYTPKPPAKELCAIAEENFAEYKSTIPSFSYTGFSVDKVPLRIHGAEASLNNNTHLLGKESLQLADIITDLKYSKNFRPLLHLGWRQVARAKNKATAVKVYAGDNFNAHYQQQIMSFNAQQAKLSEEKRALFPEQQTPSQAGPNENIDLLAQQIHLEKQQRINQITEQLNSLPEDSNTLLQMIDNEESNRSEFSLSPQKNNEEQAPVPPVQPWFLDGFFNVHLKHYLFITADFNVLDNTLAELTTKQLSVTVNTNVPKSSELDKAGQNHTIAAKPIRFKQNRRVISGEVHYFDHPYIGMIVQIRPYKIPQAEQ